MLMSDTVEDASDTNPIERCGTLIASTGSDNDIHDVNDGNIEDFGGFLLLRVAHDWAQVIARVLTQEGISKDEFLVLSLAHHLHRSHSETTTSEQVSKLAGLACDKVQKVTCELEQRGLMRRSMSASINHPSTITLTGRGVQTHFRARRQVMESWQQMFGKHLDVENELKQSLELLYYIGR